MSAKVLVTPRLVLRPLEEKDAPVLFEIFSDEDVTKYLRLDPYQEPAEAEDFVKTAMADESRVFCRGVELRETGELVGSVKIELSLPDNSGTVAFAFAKKEWGKGIAAEAVREVINYLLSQCGLNRVEGIHAVKNPAAGGVLRKAGMSYEGMAREYFRNRIGYHDCHRYAILKSDI